MIDFLKKFFGVKNTAQGANHNMHSTIFQVEGDLNYTPSSQSLVPKGFYTPKKGKDIQAIELLSIRADEKQGFNPDFYLTRANLDDTLLKRLSAFKSAIIIGKPLAGKTRAVYQLAKNELANTTFVLPSVDFSLDNPIELPTNTEKSIFVFDDIDNYVNNYDEQSLLKHFRKVLQGNSIVATCQKAKFLAVQQFLQDHNLMEVFEIIEIHPLSIEQKNEVAQRTHKQTHQGDDTIGSFMLPIEKMKANYNKLDLVEKEILRSYKLLRFIAKNNFIDASSIENYAKHRLFHHHKKNLEDMSFANWEQASKTLENLGFIQKSDDKITVEERYVTEIIEPDILERRIAFELTTYDKDVRTYAKVMHQVSSYKLAKEIFNKQVTNNVQPNVYTFNTLINKAIDYAEGRKILVKMETYSVKPNVFTFNILINKTPSYKQGKLMLSEMKSASVKPDVFTFNILMNRIANYGHGKVMLSEMEFARVDPNVVTFNTSFPCS